MPVVKDKRRWRNTDRYLENDSLQKLNLGCGLSKIPGGVNVDFQARYGPDYVHDLNSFPYPFEDNTFDYVHCSQIIEHLHDTMRVMEEIHRITKPDGIVYIGVPHFSSRIAYADPTHVRYFASTTFTHYFPAGCYMSSRDIRFEVRSKTITFSKLYNFLGVPLWANAMSRFYEDHFAHIFPAKFIHVLLQVKK